MNLVSRLLFNLWYLSSPPWDTGISPPELVEFIHFHPSGKALDLGCGTGTNAITLAKTGWQVTGIDFAYRAIRLGRLKAKQAGVQVDLRVGDVTDIHIISGTFDLVLDIGCFHSLSDQSKQDYVNNLGHLLTENGSFLSYAFLKKDGETGPGLLKSDLDHLAKQLRLVARKDGLERNQRPSVWLTYRRRPPAN